MGTEPGAEQRPEPFERVNMHLAEAVPVVIPGVLARRMTDRAVDLAPFGQPMVAVVLVDVDDAARGDHRRDQGADRLLLHIGQHPDHDLAGALDHAEDRRLLFLQRPSRPLAFEPSPSSASPFFLTASG